MGRKTQHNNLTSEALIAQINPQNMRLIQGYEAYLRSIQRSDKTILSYDNDLKIFMVWLLQNSGNKYFIDVTKRDIIAFQNDLLTKNNNSPARIRRLKSTLSSLSNYICNILDDEYPNYRNIVNKVENPVNQPVREKTVLSEEQCQELLDKLCEDKKYEKACLVALAAYSGRRKAELVRFKVSYFDDSNIVYGSLYRTPEKVKTKGRGGGKMLTLYTLANKFKPYFDLWMAQRKELGIESEWLFPDNQDPTKHIEPETLSNWADTFTRIMGLPIYIHLFRHLFTTQCSKSGLPDDVIQALVGWESAEMLKIYKDFTEDDQFAKYFDANGIKQVESKKLEEL